MKVLLVRLRLIGDVALTTPLIGAIRRHYPSAHLAYLVEAAAEPVVRGNPHLNSVIVAPRRRGVARLRDDLALIRRLRSERFDLAIDFHGGPRGSLLTWASGAPRRIGYTIKGRSWMYTEAVPRAADLSARHAVLNQWDLLAPLGIAPMAAAAAPMEMADDRRASALVARRLADAQIDASPLIVIHVSAGNPFRRWPPDAFVELTCALARRDPRRRIILTSGPSQAGTALAIAAEARMRLGDLAAAVPDIGEFDLAQLRALVTLAKVYIGGDSGPMHIAATTHTPIVGLFGPTLSGRSMPWRDAHWFAEAVERDDLPCRPCTQRVCVHSDFRCLAGIAPARVAEAAERALARTAA